MRTKIIRAYELQFWDIFIKQGYYYKVVKKDEDGIHYRPNNMHEGSATGTLGLKSQERVELVIDLNSMPHPPPHKIKVYDWHTRRYIASYRNAVEAAKGLNIAGVTDSHISDYIRRKFKTPNFNLGFHFEKVL